MPQKALTRVRIVNRFAILPIALVIVLGNSFAYAQNTIYAMTQSGLFGTLNVSTGAFNQISNPGFEPAGVAGIGSNVFIANYGGGTLYEVNLNDGSLATIGNAGATYYDFGGTTTALYGIGTDQNLYSVSSSTGASTLIGPTGLGGGGYQAMSSGGTSLYTTVPLEDGNSGLFSVNTTTGAATEIGDTGVVDIASVGFAFGQLYAADETGNLYTLNVNTGAATLIAVPGQAFWGLAWPRLALSVLHNFSGGNDGSNPFGGLIFDSTGNNLYGTAGAGGPESCLYDGLTGCGNIFKVAHKNGSWLFSPLYNFQGGSNDGEFPNRPLTIGPNGSLYGTTLSGALGTCAAYNAPGCGIVFNATPGATFPRTPFTPWLEHVLYRFQGEADGGNPFSTVVFDPSGNIYGTTVVGGTSNNGTIYKLTNSGGNWTESVVYNFAGGSDGARPLDGLTADNAGNYFGTTGYGGGSSACTGGCGTVFELSPNGAGWAERVLYRFQGTSDGMNPNAGVAIDAAGNLYGNTWQGGADGGGTVYKLTPSGGGNYTFSLLYTVPAGGGFAVGRMVVDAAGNLYEALQNGGAFNNSGQVLELTPSTGGSYNFISLHDFTGGADGDIAIPGVLLDSSGNIYGGTTFGGANICNNGAYGCGVVYEIAPNTN